MVSGPGEVQKIVLEAILVVDSNHVRALKDSMCMLYCMRRSRIAGLKFII